MGQTGPVRCSSEDFCFVFNFPSLFPWEKIFTYTHTLHSHVKFESVLWHKPAFWDIDLKKLKSTLLAMFEHI